MTTLAHVQELIDGGLITKKEARQFLNNKKDALNLIVEDMYRNYDIDTYANTKKEIEDIKTIVAGLVWSY